MTISKNFLGPDGTESETYNIESVVFDVQLAIQKSMNQQGITTEALAEKMNMPHESVSNLFSGEGGRAMTLEMLGRVQCALRENFKISGRYD